MFLDSEVYSVGNVARDPTVSLRFAVSLSLPHPCAFVWGVEHALCPNNEAPSRRRFCLDNSLVGKGCGVAGTDLFLICVSRSSLFVATQGNAAYQLCGMRPSSSSASIAQKMW